MIYFALIWFVKLFFPRYWFTPTSLIFAQSQLETGKFKSSIFKLNNNLFGMKQSFHTKGGFIETGTEREHAVYKNKFDSVRDYFIRQKNGFNIKYVNVDQYVNDTVNSNYAEDKNYSYKWKGLHSNLGFVYRNFSYLFLPTFLLVIYILAQKTGNFKVLKSLF